MKLILTICMALALAGCAHKEYYEAIKEVAKYEQIAASGPATALAAGAASSDPQVAVAAVTSAGIAEALRLSGRGGQASAIDRIAPPPSALDYVKTISGVLVDGVRVWAGIRAVDKAADVAIKGIEGNVQVQKIQSEERLGTIGKVVDGGVRQTEAATKNPTSVTNITASGGSTVAANGSIVTQEANQIECTSNLTVRAGDVAGTETAGAPDGNVAGGARSAPASATQTQPCSAASGKK